MSRFSTTEKRSFDAVEYAVGMKREMGREYPAYCLPRNRQDGSEYMSHPHYEYNLRIAANTVSWKRSGDCPDGALQRLQFRHWGPEHQYLHFEAVEGFNSKAGRWSGKEVMFDLRREEIEALHRYLGNVLDNMKSSDEAA